MTSNYAKTGFSLHRLIDLTCFKENLAIDGEMTLSLIRESVIFILHSVSVSSSERLEYQRQAGYSCSIN